MSDPLYKVFDSASAGGFIDFGKRLPEHITENLAESINLRPYQIEAVNRYLYYLDDYQNRSKNNKIYFLIWQLEVERQS